MEATTARDANKDKALDAALTQIERQFGKGAMMRLGDTPQVQIPSISTGSLGLDVALGIGGLPKGRIVEIYGPESSGKTTLTLQVIAEAQKAGGTCAFIDAEHALDPIYAQNLGVDIENLLVSQPDTGEQALEICDMVVRSGAVDVVVIDSVAALTPKAEIEGDMGDHHVGLQARLMSQALRKMAGNIKNSNTLVIVGNETRVKVIKNKVAPPFKQTEFQIMYGKGIYRMGEVVDMGVQLGLVDKAGAWYSYKGDKIGQGKKNACEYLTEHAALGEEIEGIIRAKLLNDQSAVVEEAPIDEAIVS
jgi:recombination protein RecA